MGSAKEELPTVDYSFDFIKEKLMKCNLECLENNMLKKFCGKLELKTTGSKEELIERLSVLNEEALFEKRVTLISKEYKFKTALPRENVPPKSAGWKFDTGLFPKIRQEDIDAYQTHKRQGKKGQYRKAVRMFQSRRMKSIKVFKTGDGELYVKASVLKSFSMEVTHTVTVLFNSNAPRKAYCECPVGNCGLCCHAILVLLQLKHFTLHKELLLALTCTQKLQRWHCPNSGKTSAKVKAASHIRLKYFRNIPSARKAIMHKRSEKKVEGLPENHKDWDKSDWLTRDVCEISSKVEDRLKQQMNVDISNHFLKTLTKYKIESGMYFHLCYKNSYSNSVTHKEHDYASQHLSYNEGILTPRFRNRTEDIWHSVLDPSEQPETAAAPAPTMCDNSIFSQEKTQQLLSLLSQCSEKVKTVQLPKYEKITRIDASNYVNVTQGSKEWMACRVGVITASKLPSLLGLCGQKEFDSSWFCVRNKLNESTYRPKKFRNFERGKMFEAAALDNFSKVSGMSKCS